MRERHPAGARSPLRLGALRPVRGLPPLPDYDRVRGAGPGRGAASGSRSSRRSTSRRRTCTRLEEVAAEIEEGGLRHETTLAIEGVGWLLPEEVRAPLERSRPAPACSACSERWKPSRACSVRLSPVGRRAEAVADGPGSRPAGAPGSGEHPLDAVTMHREQAEERAPDEGRPDRARLGRGAGRDRRRGPADRGRGRLGPVRAWSWWPTGRARPPSHTCRRFWSMPGQPGACGPPGTLSLRRRGLSASPFRRRSRIASRAPKLRFRHQIRQSLEPGGGDLGGAASRSAAGAGRPRPSSPSGPSP